MITHPYDAAQHFIAAGYSIMPICFDGSKRPAVPKWKPFSERFATPDELIVWYRSDQPSGIAVVCGPISGNLEVLDVDQVDLAPLFEQIINATCPSLLDEIITVKTPRDGGRGRQYWYRLPYAPAGHEDLARGLRTGDGGQETITTLIETRSTGNYVVAAGSPVTVHAEGLPYERIHGPLFSRLGQITKLEHEKLLAAARLFNEIDVQRDLEYCRFEREPYTGPPRPGDIYNQAVDWRQLLEHCGWSEVSDNRWRRPGKTSGGYSAALGHFVDDQGEPLLSVFSRNAGPLAPAPDKDVRVLTKFDVLANFEYAGDYSAAALAITEDSRFREQLAQSQREYYQQTAPSSNALQGSWLCDVEEKPIDWLWPGRIARGFFHVIAGDPGLGKSMITVDLAGRITTGKPWPDQPDNAPEPGSVFIISAEDTLSHQIKPRCRLAGANMAKVKGFTGFVQNDGQCTSFSIRTNLQQLADELAVVPDCQLIVIDPLAAFLGAEDSHRNSDVRAALHPLTAFCEAHNIALVAIEHLNKDSRNSVQYRISGSIGIAAAARATWYTFRDPDDDGRVLFLQGKINFAAQQTGLAYRIERAADENLPVLHWEPQPLDMKASDFGASCNATKQEALQNWLQQVLPAKRADVIQLGKQLGFNERAIDRAFSSLDGIREKRGFPAVSYWQLPVQTTDCTDPGAAGQTVRLYTPAVCTAELMTSCETEEGQGSTFCQEESAQQQFDENQEEKVIKNSISSSVQTTGVLGRTDGTEAGKSVQTTVCAGTSEKRQDGLSNDLPVSSAECDWEVIPCTS